MDVRAHEHYMLLEEFTKRVRISNTTGRRWLASGKVRGIRIGHKHLIPESELARLLAAGVQGGK